MRRLMSSAYLLVWPRPSAPEKVAILVFVVLSQVVNKLMI